MRNYWLTERLFRLDKALSLRLLRDFAEVGETAAMRVKRSPTTHRSSEAELVFTVHPERNAIALLDCRGEHLHFTPGENRRSVFLPGYMLEQLLEDQYAEALVERLIDVSNIDEAGRRSGLKHLAQQNVRSIFIAGGYRRLHFATPSSSLAMVLEVAPGDLWATHGASSAVRQPAAADLSLARQVHEASLAFAVNLQRAAVPVVAPVAVLPRLVDGWVTLNKLRELGVTTEEAQRKVLAVRDADGLFDLVGEIPDTAIDSLETHLRLKEARQAERKLDLVDIVNVGVARPRTDLPATYEAALASLTSHQRDVVTLERAAPIRLKGGPGTGKTLTAMLRAGHLLRRAETAGEPCRVGFFVFNRELGEKVVDDLKHFGLDVYFEGADNSCPQRLVLASLFDWGERFLDLKSLGVEPLAPYRADRVDAQRHSALSIAVEEARRTLSQAEHQHLWQLFDTKNRHDFRELEMEISQFIKARELTDLNAYLAERRPANWWLASAERPFKKFVWEIYRVYDRTLRQLGFIDADDVINDCLKEVAKNTWQQYKKPNEGFDYLIVDEAQDFFRNQLTLVSQLAKSPTGLMLCYDEAQAVYSRYPNLRELGFDSETSFFGRSLESNFRSTKQIVRALKALFVHNPAATLQASWGEYDAGVGTGPSREGPLPVGAGFATEAMMLKQIEDLVARLRADSADTTCAIVCFEEGLRHRLATTLRERGYPVDEPGTTKRSRGARSIFLTDAKRAKGQQFDACILAGVGRDQVPDFSDTKSELQRASRREDALREFIVAMSRARRQLHFLWTGPEPSEFITAMGSAVELKA